MIKLETTEIAGHRWSLPTLPATQGLEILTKLIGMIGAPLGTIGGAASLADLSEQGDLMGKALGALTSKIAEPGTVALIKTLLADLKRDDKGLSFDLDFAGDYGTLCQLIAWALKVNFSSFFVGNPALAGFGSLLVARQTPGA